jgi:hypothetical protein
MSGEEEIVLAIREPSHCHDIALSTLLIINHDPWNLIFWGLPAGILSTAPMDRDTPAVEMLPRRRAKRFEGNGRRRDTESKKKLK